MTIVSVESAAANRQFNVWWRFAVVIVVLGLTNIYALYTHQRLLVYVTKPGTMLAIIALAGLRTGFSPDRYTILILTGLTCSLIGDVLLMLPGDLFVAGLIAFLVAHILYIGAFRTGIKKTAPRWLAVPFYGLGAVMFWILLPGLGEMKIPVTVYLVVILTMAWQSFNRWNETRESKSLLAPMGALLFVISDSIIAFNRFRYPLVLADGLIMSTYFGAQWLIALSV